MLSAGFECNEDAGSSPKYISEGLINAIEELNWIHTINSIIKGVRCPDGLRDCCSSSKCVDGLYRLGHDNNNNKGKDKGKNKNINKHKTKRRNDDLIPIFEESGDEDSADGNAAEHKAGRKAKIFLRIFLLLRWISLFVTENIVIITKIVVLVIVISVIHPIITHKLIYEI